MKFGKERSHSSTPTDWASRKQREQSTMINNYMGVPSNNHQRSKSVLFLRTPVGGNLLNRSSPTRQSRESDNNDLSPSPRSDSSRGSRYDNKRHSSVARTETERCKSGRQSRSASVSSDETTTMDDNSVLRSAWTSFQEQIKNIDDTSDYFTQIPKPSFKSSDEFQRVMKDLYGNPEYGQKIGYNSLKGKVGNISAMASRMVARRRKKKDEDIDDVDMYEVPQPSKTTIENAKRGWRAVRRHVQEKVSANKCKDSNLKWTMLGHTLRGMSNAERTRMDLYQRYGIVAKLNNDGQYVRKNTMLSQRAQSAARDTMVQNPEESGSKSRVKHQLRARSSLLPRCTPNYNSNMNKQRPFYSRQRTLSLAPKQF